MSNMAASAAFTIKIVLYLQNPLLIKQSTKREVDYGV
jgi:hypothetical protein